jgi:hypothetical protein
VQHGINANELESTFGFVTSPSSNGNNLKVGYRELLCIFHKKPPTEEPDADES